MNEVIADLTTEHGTDPSLWGENGRRNAVCEALQQDEAQKQPDLLSDCLIALAAKPEFRRSIIEAHEHQNAAMRLAALGLAFERGISNYVLEQLESLAEEREGEWISADREARDMQEIDSRARYEAAVTGTDQKATSALCAAIRSRP